MRLVQLLYYLSLCWLLYTLAQHFFEQNKSDTYCCLLVLTWFFVITAYFLPAVNLLRTEIGDYLASQTRADQESLWYCLSTMTNAISSYG